MVNAIVNGIRKPPQWLAAAAMALGMGEALHPPIPAARPAIRLLWSMGQDSEILQQQKDPKGGELFAATAKSWETVMEAGRYTDVQIVCWSCV